MTSNNVVEGDDMESWKLLLSDHATEYLRDRNGFSHRCFSQVFPVCVTRFYLFITDLSFLEFFVVSKVGFD